MNEIRIIKDGYVFNKETQVLEYFKLLEAHFTLNDPVITYVCMLGGNKTQIHTDNLKVYIDENEYMKGNHITGFSITYEIRNVLNSTNGYAWTYSNGESRHVCVNDVPLIYDAETLSVRVADGTKYFSTQKQVWKYHDLVVKHEDGREETIECLASKMALTDEQKSLLDELRDVMKRVQDSGLDVYSEPSDNRLMAINLKNVALYSVDYMNNDEDGDVYYDATDMSVEVCRGVWDRYEEYSILVKK